MTFWRLHGIDFHVETGRAWGANEDQVEVALSGTQRRVLSALLQAKGTTTTYGQIAELASRSDLVNESASSQQFIYQIRTRLQSVSEDFKGIVNVPGKGYRIATDEVAETPADIAHALEFDGVEYRPVVPATAALKSEPTDVVSEFGRDAGSAVPSIVPRLRGEALRSLVRRYSRPPHTDRLSQLEGSILQVHDRVYPVAVFPASPGQAIESVLPSGNVDARHAMRATPDAMAIRDPRPRIKRWLAANPGHSPVRAERETASGWNLAMTSLYREGDEIRMTANLAEYGLILDTCDALIDEAFNTDGRLPQWSMRDAVERDERPFESAFCRAAGIGVAALITVVDRDEHNVPVLRALVGRRSANVGTYADTWHVAPAGMLNWRFSGEGPHHDDATPWAGYEPDDILRSILVEYIEELRNVGRMEVVGRRGDVDRHPGVVALKDHARFEFTGIAMDLANLRPEICVLIYLDQPRSFRLNYEYGALSGPTGDTTTGRERRELLPITVATPSGDFDHDALHILDPAETVPSGAAAFWLGTERARELFKRTIDVR